MDKIRIAKVERVVCSKLNGSNICTLHLTAHHLIFQYEDQSLEEMWVPYPLISLVTRLPQTLTGKNPLTIRTRTFENLLLSFENDIEALDVFESIKELTVANSITQLYAFSYVPNPPLPTNDGWSLYSPREEFSRMGIGSRSKAWRFTDINKDYSFCPTYPARMVVPTRISDNTLQYAAKYRSKARIPVLTYLHRTNYGSITRSSQPMVGLTNNRSIQDEKLIEAIFQTHHSPESRVTANVYGSTCTNLIIDARPTANAVANTAKGAGSENMDYYKDAKKAYLGIDHIHTMRESLAKIVEAIRETKLPDESGLGESTTTVDREALRRSGWLRHLGAVMEGTALIVKNVHVNSSHVVIHCSDGWDRTSQLSAMAQLCLDPHYRTMKGFQILIEKDWLSFGHKFLDRCGHLSSEKFFLSPAEGNGGGGGAEAAQAFFASVQNKFTSPGHLKETSPIFHQFLECVRQVQRQFPERFEFNERFLHQLYYHLYSCQFGTFLWNCERERKVDEAGGPPPFESTVSIWDWLNTPEETNKNRNPDYDPSLDDLGRKEGKPDMGVLIPNSKDIRFWHGLYGRTDEEMNGKFMVAQAQGSVEAVGPVESEQDDPVFSPPSIISTQSLSRLNPSVSSIVGQRSVSPSNPLSPIRHDEEREPEPLQTLTQRQQSTGIRRSPSPFAKSNAATDVFSSGGMRSMWGRLSTNASAALSVVQGAVEDVTKEFKKTGSNQEPREGELRSRSELRVWGEGDGVGSSSSWNLGSPPIDYSTATTNPWATTTMRENLPPTSSGFSDNPWNSFRQTQSSTSLPTRPPASKRLSDLFGADSQGLPHDPTISESLPKSPVMKEETKQVVESTTSARSNSIPTDKPLDPLGVGW
ncbi:protein phosphatase [Thelephora terrestris]|uniref:Protein phosphatase n=1 Tax=Thelephora terrestris TaxID=56493 RepID=A0A9P6LBU0_9AGAM|nr:protein phosphatase [Thelephora terrestris]